ncbi:aminoglycoside phosphotransferase family protein [Candidatus Bathyarchaeota archaeon]|nr:MAG: aminoglycoside phosphotransferase family protein [Candidatus Bathyarchaeota archaeon]
MDLKVDSLRAYLSELYGGEVEVLRVGELGKAAGEPGKVLKGYGYGTPLLIEFSLDGSVRRVVLNTIRPGGFGHERMSDRAGILLWQARVFNLLPRHVRAVDVGSFMRDGSLKSLGDCTEFFLLTEWVEGREYYRDLDRIREEGHLRDLDLRRVEALAEYLAEIHAEKRDDPGLYVRRIRELIGHGECLMGLTDSYPQDLDYIRPSDLMAIERRCIEWRWRIKGRTHRLSQVHGDFHPWNILFREGTDFTVLDRSRGEWGEPADDVSSMTINYLFYALRDRGTVTGPFQRLWRTFWDRYLDATGDEELLEVIQPFYTWRALVIASPLWYPNLSLGVRRGLLNFARNVLEVDVFDPEGVEPLLGREG